MVTPPAAWVLAHQPCFPVCEETILAQANALEWGVLRSGEVRERPSIPEPPRRVNPSPAVLLTSDVDMLSVEDNNDNDDSLAVDQRLADSPLFVGDDGYGDVAVRPDDDDDDDDDSFGGLFSPLRAFAAPSPPPPPTPSPPLYSPITPVGSPITPPPAPSMPAPTPPPRYTEFPAQDPVSGPSLPSATVASLADLRSALTTVGVQVRPWNWSTIARKTSEVYVPQSVGKWWYDYYQECKGNATLELRSSHASRIMESELGETLKGDNACDNCRAEGAECRVYTEKGRGQVRHPGSACARCRARGPKDGGCSVSKRRPNRPPDPPDRPPPRHLQPRPPGGPGPGAGGVGIAV